MFNLFLSSQPSARHSPLPPPASIDSEDSDESPEAHWEYPPPLLLVSSESSPAQDIQRFISTGANIVIGTPGRVEEFLLGKGRNVVNVKELEILVLDEADRCVSCFTEFAVSDPFNQAFLTLAFTKPLRAY